LNEVGGHPDHFGVSMAAFHKANAQRAANSPYAMLATSTHDTKRGEDVRARLAVLAELPEEWKHQVRVWNKLLRARIGDLEGMAPPDGNDEYLFYQLLLGAWPAELTGDAERDPDAVRAFAHRLEGAIIKSVREAKSHSNWAFPNTAYEDGMLGFVRAALDMSRPNAFLDNFLPFQERVAKFGVSNSLVQTALKLTLPGMPDIYQGSELWDLSLVDPDNRRPVDYATRERLLAETMVALSGDRAGAMAEMLENWRDGRIKLAVTSILLAARRRFPSLFSNGTYEPLTVSGPNADQICAFVRTSGDEAVLVAARRFPAQATSDQAGEETWIAQPRTVNDVTRWRDLLTGELVSCRAGDAVSAQKLPRILPVVVLIPEDMLGS
jgi:(1->4)-alpha-D-glucan 1-alpha-D-glucosylmutase